VTRALLSVRRLRVYYRSPPSWPWQSARVVKAVDGVDFDLHAGEALGVAGESGCGKSTLARAIIGMQPVSSGSIRLMGEELTRLDPVGWRDRRRDMQMVFQDPFASLDPRMTVRESVAEPLLNLFPDMSGAERQRRVLDTLERVGLSARQLRRYPHEFSGGQCQRVGIARALVVSPRLLICDEAVSALDVSIRAQIINLLRSLQRDLKLAMIFIAHDLSVLRRISDRVLIMYLGKIMEHAACHELFQRANHPYTRALMSAILTPNPCREPYSQRIILRGELPSPTNPPGGCVFRSRCPWAVELCAREVPALRRLGPRHASACHYAGELSEAFSGPVQGVP
jgi:oligopeptide transport system ATP-binding protein